jgi:hypothetical protein
MSPEQYRRFQKLARKSKLLYSVIRDRDGRGKLLDVILPVTELDRANAIFERILYKLPWERKQEPEKPEPCREKAAPAPEKERQEVPSKKDSPSQRDSPGTRARSSTLKKSGASRTTSERPSVEARLKAYREQLRKPPAPAKVKAKSRPKRR